VFIHTQRGIDLHQRDTVVIQEVFWGTRTGSGGLRPRRGFPWRICCLTGPWGYVKGEEREQAKKKKGLGHAVRGFCVPFVEA
jgi:hypothetical protein